MQDGAGELLLTWQKALRDPLGQAKQKPGKTRTLRGSQGFDRDLHGTSFPARIKVGFICQNSTGTFHFHSVQASFFLENRRKPTETAKEQWLKRMEEESTSRTLWDLDVQSHNKSLRSPPKVYSLERLNG